ncbi:MAG: hypothetical protein MJ175_12530 [Clostridia bacterium]|nr:hypothetical protein [Clostridia bacterium]
MKNLDLSAFVLQGAESLGDGCYRFPKNQSTSLVLDFPKGTFAGEPFAEEQYLSMDVTACGGSSAGLCWLFWDSDHDWSDMSIKMGVLPGLKTRLALPFSALSAKTLFMPRTPGKLKTVVGGRPLYPDRLHRFAICVDKTPEDLILKIENVTILDTEPDYPLEPVKMVDALGQKKCTDWPGKTKDADTLIAALQKEAGDADETPLPMRSRYGGWTGKRFDEGTGFFALHHDGRRFWLKDPDGYAFFSMGFDCVSAGSDCNLQGITDLCEELPDENAVGWSHNRWNGKECTNFNFFTHNLSLAFGDDFYGTWADMIRTRLIRWGCNTIACWSDIDFIRREKMPYVLIGPGYPTTEIRIFRDFPDVYSEDFKNSAKAWAGFLNPVKEDPNLLGYFMSNEPQWAFVNNLNIAAYALNTPEMTATKRHILDTLSEKYGTIEACNAAWGTAFSSFAAMEEPFDATELAGSAPDDLTDLSREMIRTNIRIPAEAAKEADPNHLNLGIRYAWLSSPVLAAGCEYTDVFSFNCYQMDPYDTIERFSEITGKPVIIGEFHFGALDRGMDATGLRGVTTQAQRGVAYRRYMHRAASHPMCLGAHYFTLYDQAYLGRFDGENYQIGALDVCSMPYSDFIEGIVKTHSELYDVADGKLPATEETAEEIPAIAF